MFRKLPMHLSLFAMAVMLTGCGLAETAATGATTGAAAAEQAQEGQRQMEKVKADIAEAQKVADEARAAAEAAAQ